MVSFERIGVVSFGVLTAWILFASQALAQSAAPASGQPQGSVFAVLMEMLPMFAVVFLIFYFMIIRPQQQKLLEHKKLTDSLKKGDGVVTSGGIVGRVAAVEKDHVLLEVSSNVKIRFEMAHVQKRAEKPGVETQSA